MIDWHLINTHHFDFFSEILHINWKPKITLSILFWSVWRVAVSIFVFPGLGLLTKYNELIFTMIFAQFWLNLKKYIHHPILRKIFLPRVSHFYYVLFMLHLFFLYFTGFKRCSECPNEILWCFNLFCKHSFMCSRPSITSSNQGIQHNYWNS